MTKFKSWDEFYAAYQKALKDNNLVVNTVAFGDEGFFFAFDSSHPGILWSFNEQGVLKKYKFSPI